MSDMRAEVLLPTTALTKDLGFFTRDLGFRLDMIYPADNPAVVVLSGHGLRLRLDAHLKAAPGQIRILTDDYLTFAEGKTELTSPGGTIVTLHELNPPLVLPATEHAFVVRRLADQAPWVIGRAGMAYRDLVPTRLGGAIIASHIRVPDGKVPDMVHYHKVGFQLIFCVNGWVDVLYEDQGGLRRLTRGDCFIQPPQIRHRVMEAGEDIEVIEIGVPAEHVTEIDHEMTLPTPHDRPDREWDGQRFVHNLAQGAAWTAFRQPGYICRDTTINANTKGVAGVQVVRRGEGAPVPTRHDSDILFGFVMGGEMTLKGEGKEPYRLVRGDAFVTPPGMVTEWADPTDDIEILEVSLPGAFSTTAA
ncbi:cupin [Frigidibacter sp. SD6-1]|uniref:cupin n=1 Tax=Frigidibacter sp. SD6-1 TaxID=3032581 RepID=UPI0024E01BF6|nr:cupin [Frigidibacter sp. SD6-1]